MFESTLLEQSYVNEMNCVTAASVKAEIQCWPTASLKYMLGLRISINKDEIFMLTFARGDFPVAFKRYCAV